MFTTHSPSPTTPNVPFYFDSNFSNYRARFSMPGYLDTESLFYSWNIGPVHMIAVNTEAYYFLNYGLKPLSRQYQWLVDDLEVSAYHFSYSTMQVFFPNTLGLL